MPSLLMMVFKIFKFQIIIRKHTNDELQLILNLKLLQLKNVFFFLIVCRHVFYNFNQSFKYEDKQHQIYLLNFQMMENSSISCLFNFSSYFLQKLIRVCSDLLMENQVDLLYSLNQMKRLHKRVAMIWSEKQKYLTSMLKSGKQIEDLTKKQSTPERQKLHNKLNAHITRIMVEYIPVIDELSLINKQANKLLEEISILLAHQQASPEMIEMMSMVDFIHNINLKASTFQKKQQNN